MAEKVTIKGGDLDGSVLENAASEATLVLLKEAMDKLARSQGLDTRGANRGLRDLGSASNDTAEEIEDLGDSLGLLKIGVTGLTFVFKGLFGIVGGLTSAFGTTLSSVTQFSEMMITTVPTITDFTGAIADSKLNILGLGTAIDSLAKIIYGNYTSFQELSKSGILLGDMVGTLSDMYTGSGVTLDQMSASLAANSERLAMLGTATTGARLAMELNRRAFKNNREELLKWGMNFQEQGETFTNFLALNAYALRRRKMSEDEVVELSQSYAINLRKLADYSGKQASEMQSEMEKMNLNKGFEVFLANLNDPELANRYRAIVADAGANFEEGGAELAMSMVMGKPPLTDAARKLAGVSDEVVGIMQGTLDLANNYQGEEAAFVDAMKAKQAEQMDEINRYIDSMADIAATTYMMGTPHGEALNTALAGLMKITGRITDSAGDLDPYAQAVAAYDNATASLRDSISKMMTSFFTNPTVISGLERFATWVEYYTPIITAELEKFATWLKEFDPTLYNPFDPDGRQRIYDAFWETMTSVGETISGWWNGENGLKLRSVISEFFRGLVTAIEDMFVNSTTLNTLLGIDREEVAYRQATTGANIDVENALTAALGEGFWNMSEIAGVQSVGGQENFDQLIAQLGDRAANYSSTNEQIEAALRVLGEKYEAGTADDNERRLFADAIANLTDPNAAPLATGVVTQSVGDYEFGPMYGTPGLNDGTRGFQNFGKETVARLHGLEAVVPRDTDAGEFLEKYFTDDWKFKSDSFSNIGNSFGNIANNINDLILSQDEKIRKVINASYKNTDFKISDPSVDSRSFDYIAGTITKFVDEFKKVQDEETSVKQDTAQAFSNVEKVQSDVAKKLDNLNNTMLTVARILDEGLSVQTKTMKGVKNFNPDYSRGIGR